MTAVASILRALPRADAGLAPADPPLLSADEFGRLLDEVVDGRADLGWRLAGDLPAALAHRLDRGERGASDGPLIESLRLGRGEDVDAFSGRVAGPPGRTPGERLMQTAAWARVAAELLAERGPAPHIGILDGSRIWVAESPAGRPLTDIAMDIGWALSVRRFEPIGRDGVGHADVPAVVALDRRSIQEARHAHRTEGLTGPWMGVCIGNRAHHGPPLELVAASRAHMAPADLAGFMRRLHLSADALLAEHPESAVQTIARELTRKYGDLWRPRKSWSTPPRSDGRDEYVARSIDPAGGDEALGADLVTSAWGLGVALQRFATPTGWTGPLSPAFRVLHRLPDGERRAVLTAVRFDGLQPEPRAAFERRFEAQCRREAGGFGLLSEWQRLIARQPLQSDGRARLARALDRAARMGGPAGAVNGVAELAWSELPPRREAPWRVYSGSTPPVAAWGAPFSGGVALHLHRIGDSVDLLATARGSFAERGNAARFLDLVIEAIRQA